jgi:hypothetical protein
VFKTKYIICLTIFVIFLIITSFVKNKSRLLEKGIISLNVEIKTKEKNLNEAQLDFYYLSSPAKLEKKLSIIGFNNYQPISYSKIFLRLSDFSLSQNKFSTLKNLNEKKIQKKE